MKVLQVMAGDTHGGAENFFMRLVTALGARGLVQQAVIKPHPERVETLRRHKIPVHTSSFSKPFPLFTRHKLTAVIKDFQPDIVLSWMSRASALCPSGSFVHAGRLGGYYNLKYYQKCDYLIGNTADIVNYFQENQWPSAYARYIPNFVEIPSPETLMALKPLGRSVFGSPEKVPLLLTLGRLHTDKAFDILIRALSFIPQAHLWIAGVGPELTSLQELAQQVDVAERVKFIGWHQEIARLYQTCDVYICPSRIEPLGNVILEAWAHQKPVVAAKSKGPLGLIRSGETGMLVDCEDVQGLAEAIRQVLASPRLQNQLASQAFQELQTHFSQEKVVTAYMNFFAEIKGKKRN